MKVMRFKYFGCIIIVSISFNLFGQAGKEVINYFPKTKQVKERYYVQKDVKNGPCIFYIEVSPKLYESTIKSNKGDSSFIKGIGYYKNGLKDSLWIEYRTTPFVKRLQSIGVYRNDNKVGIWRNYIENGNIIEQYNYDSNKHLPYLLNVSIPVLYPEASRDSSTQGTVLAQYNVESNCNIDSIRIVKGVSKACDKEVMNALNRYAEECRIYRAKYKIECKPQRGVQQSFNFRLQ
jgi:antitoxin component YwqK of YwqJK toxin-antitoxin module